MSSIKINSKKTKSRTNNSLLKSKTTKSKTIKSKHIKHTNKKHTNKKHTNIKHTNKKHTNIKHTNIKHTNKKHTNKKHTNKKQHIIDKYCGFYKNDINGKPNKKLYNSCKINKYCRKYKCQDIDSKILKAKQKYIGHNYNKIIFDNIKSFCPVNNQSILDEDEIKNTKKQKQCEKKAIKQIYKDNNLEDIYKKSIECDNIICSKEQKIFNINLFRQKQIKLKKSQIKQIDDADFTNDPDHDLIERGD